MASQLAMTAQRAAETRAGDQGHASAQSAVQAKTAQKEKISVVRRAQEASEKAMLKKVRVAVYSAPQTLTITPALIVLSFETVPLAS